MSSSYWSLDTSGLSHAYLSIRVSSDIIIDLLFIYNYVFIYCDIYDFSYLFSSFLLYFNFIFNAQCVNRGK